MERTKYLIIGNSTAAINAVEAIRALDKEGTITILSDEPYHTYARPLITYYLGKKVDKSRIYYREKGFYDAYHVKTLLGKRAITLDTDVKRILLNDNFGIEFEKLLISTGGSPFVPEIPGGDLDGIFTFTTLDDAYEVEHFIKRHEVKRAVVVGGGLIGLKVTEALIALGINVTIVELADRILSATFDKIASSFIERALKEIGCTAITSNTVEGFNKGRDKRVAGVILKDNTNMPADMVIMAIGVRPRIELVRETAIKTNRGILVNPYLETSVNDIYAAGDVIETYDFIYDMERPLAILPNASRQGRFAGYNMAGAKRRYTGSLPMNSIELAGIPTISVGLTDPAILRDEERKKGIEILKDIDRENYIYKKVVLEGNRIVGTIFIGRIERAGIYTGLIKDKADISAFKTHLLKDDFGLISLPKEYRKHLVTGLGIEV